MSSYGIGMLASSKAGHDKCKVYVIIMEEPEYVYLVDGKFRTLTKPKKKNKKHIQPIHYIDLELKEAIDTGTLRDEHVKRTIKLYELRNEIF